MKKAYENEYEATRERLESAVADMQELASKMREYWEERSEKWQESERGETWADFIDALENLEAEVPEWPE